MMIEQESIFRLRPAPAVRQAAVLAGALLWGVVEMIALARARWTR